MVVSPVYNASQGPSASSQQERIPAWKRLGLKLKNAKDTDEVGSSTNGASRSTIKRSPPDTRLASRVEGSPAEPVAKRRRVESHTNESSQGNGSLARPSGPFSEDQNARLKKKVSFTAETKLEDGGKELIAGWEQDEFAYYEQKAAENDAREALKVVSDVQNNPQKSAIQAKKPFDTPRKSKDALDYLNIYHRSRSSWKFNKNREVWILRHMLSTEDIPVAFNIALAVYVHGLGSRQARSRLLNQCQEALEKEGQEESYRDETASSLGHMEDPKRRKAYHDDAVRKFKRSLEDNLDDEQRKADEDDPEYQRWLSRRRRAELLLWAVMPSNSSTEEASMSSHEVKSEPHSSTSAKSAIGGSANGVLPHGHLFKKKNRTVVVVEASSSSEDESESSDGEGDGSRLANGKGYHDGVTDFSSSADESSSAASSANSDSNSEAESTTVTSRPTGSVSSSDDESETGTHSASGKRQQSAISISSRSDTSTLPASLISNETSSSASTEDDDEQDESDSRSGNAAAGTQSSMNGDSDTTRSNDDEDEGQSDSD
jgi:hypothetical protein